MFLLKFIFSEWCLLYKTVVSARMVVRVSQQRWKCALLGQCSKIRLIVNRNDFMYLGQCVKFWYSKLGLA